MFFPLQISGKHRIYIDASSQNYIDYYLTSLHKNLENAGAWGIKQRKNEIFFKGPWLSLKIFDLKLITYGLIKVSIEGKEVTVSYKVRYTFLFIICSLMVFGFLLPAMLRDLKIDSTLAIFFSLFGWLWLYGVNIIFSYSCFRKCIIKSQ